MEEKHDVSEKSNFFNLYLLIIAMVPFFFFLLDRWVMVVYSFTYSAFRRNGCVGGFQYRFGGLLFFHLFWLSS